MRYRLQPVGGTHDPVAIAIEDTSTGQFVASSDGTHLAALEELVRLANLGMVALTSKEPAP